QAVRAAIHAAGSARPALLVIATDHALPSRAAAGSARAGVALASTADAFQAGATALDRALATATVRIATADARAIRHTARLPVGGRAVPLDFATSRHHDQAEDRDETQGYPLVTRVT